MLEVQMKINFLYWINLTMKIYKSKENLLNIKLIIKDFKIRNVTEIKHSVVILIKYKTVNKSKVIFKTIITGVY
jgi:hypothetical protein